jgi:hypothetical protein
VFQVDQANDRGWEEMARVSTLGRSSELAVSLRDIIHHHRPFLVRCKHDGCLCIASKLSCVDLLSVPD